MQSTSQTWKGLFASGAALQTRAVINGVACEGVAPVIHRATMQDSLAVGNVVSASLSLTLRSPGSIPRSAAVVIETRLSDGQAVSEWLPQGTFYISRRMRDPVSGVLALTCYDALLKANAVWVPSAGAWPRTLAAVTAELAALLGVTLDSRTVVPTGAAYVMSEPAEGTTLRDALSLIAQAAGGNWIMSPAGLLRLVRLGESGATVDVAGVVGGIDVGQAGAVTGVRNTVDGDVTLTGDDTGIVVDVSLSPAIAAAMAEGLIGLAYTPFQLTGAIYDPAAELGDCIRAGAGGEVVSALCGEQVAYGAAFRGDISAPDPGEVTDEYPYISKIGNEVSLLKADVKEIAENAIVRVDVEYAQNQSTTVAPASGWSTDAPQWREGYYIWQRTATSTAEGTSYSAPTCISGRDGEDGSQGPQGPQGQTGVGVSGVVEQYYLSTSSTTQTGGSWSTAQPQWVSGKYIWTRSQVTWTNGTTTTTTPVLAQAINGANSTANTANSTANTANSTANAANNTANAASAAVTALDDALNQQEIFNRLTNNGAAQGLVLYNGQLYVNATYINAGYLSATRIQGGTLTLGGQNETYGDLKILDASGNTVARIYSAGIAFADTTSLHGVKISRGGVVELSQISVYGSNAQFKAKILPLTSAGISIADEDGVSFASFSSSSSSIKSTFSVEDGSGGRLTVSQGRITLTDSDGSKIWMPGNGEVEVQAKLVVTKDITVQQSGEAAIKAICRQSGVTRANIWLDSAPSGYHGLWSNGYYNGSGFVSSGKWMIYRDTSGDVTLAGNATGNVAKTGDIMTGNLLVGTASSGVERSVRAISNAGSIYLYAEGNSSGNRGIYTTNSSSSGKYVMVIGQDNEAILTGRATGNVSKTGDDTMTGNLTVQQSGEAAVKVECARSDGTRARIWLDSAPSGYHGLWSDGYYNGSTFVTNGKWLLYRNTSGDIIIPGSAATRENLGTYLYLDNATPANVYARLNALNTNETVNIGMAQAVTNYLTGGKVNIYLAGQVRKNSATEYRFMGYRSNGAKMYIWQATVTANGVSNVNCCEYSGTTI